MGGVGKTQLAARYAREHREDYDVIWWLRCEQEATLRGDLAELAAALSLAGVEVDEQDAIDMALGWLERNGRWLIVFDNVSDADAISKIVPEGAGGHVLITSRAHGDWRALHAQPLALDVWEREESVEFLVQRTGQQDATAAAQVAVALGDLPLAVEQAAAYACTKAISLSAYLERLCDRAPELFAAGAPAGYEHTIATVWALAFEQIAMHPVAVDLAGVCAHLAPERIPRELLEAWTTIGPGADVTAGAVDDAIELLLRYALLTASADDTFTMHRLIQQVSRAGSDASARTRVVAYAVELLDTLLPAQPREHEQWPACVRLLAHAMSAIDHASASDAALEPTARVLAKAGLYHHARAEFSSARHLLERALAIQKTVYGFEHPKVAITLGNLGTVQQQLGKLDTARITQQRALAINEAVHGPEHPEVARTLGSLGDVQRLLGEYEAARVTQQRALSIQEAAYGADLNFNRLNNTNEVDFLEQQGYIQ
jgi:tetratricopeptide (TPR) repeat protein